MSRDSGTLLLAVDTSTRFAGVGIDDGSGSVVCRSWRSEQNHGAELMPAIVAMLEELGRTPADITHLAVANGPGGFSALRVGIGVVFGLATPRDLPIAAISTHEIEVAPYVDRVGRSTALYSLLPAGRGEVAWARYVDGNEVATGLAPPEKLAAACPAGFRVLRRGGDDVGERGGARQIAHEWSADPRSRGAPCVGAKIFCSK